MSQSNISLDLSRLEKVRHHNSGKTTSRCPACAEDGHDRIGNHLAVFADGRFACAAHPGDGEHRRRISALVGISRERPVSDEERRVWIERRIRERNRDRQKSALLNSAKTQRNAIIERHLWTPADVWDDSPQRIDCDLVATDPSHFLASLFPAHAFLWTGNVHDSGKPHHLSRWKPCSEWVETADSVGPMTSPAVWKSGTISRSADNVVAAPFTVLDFDGLDGIKPATPTELSQHLLDSLALIRWLREGMDWRLAAILWTGGKSLHAWFHTPPADVLQSLATVAFPLGMDAGLIGRPELPLADSQARHIRTPEKCHKSSGWTPRLSKPHEKKHLLSTTIFHRKHDSLCRSLGIRLPNGGQGWRNSSCDSLPVACHRCDPCGALLQSMEDG